MSTTRRDIKGGRTPRTTEVRLGGLLGSVSMCTSQLRRLFQGVRRGLGRVPCISGLVRVGKVKLIAIDKFVTRIKSVKHFSGPGRLRGLTKCTVITGSSKGRGKRDQVDCENEGHLECMLCRTTVSLMKGGTRFGTVRRCCQAQARGPLGGVRSMMTITYGVLEMFCAVLAGNISCSPLGLVNSVEEPRRLTTWRTRAGRMVPYCN